jgi:hypothetical protein
MMEGDAIMNKLMCLLVGLLVLCCTSSAQSVNWKSFDGGRENALELGFGYDFGTAAQVGYTRIFHAFRPIAAGIGFSLPMGGDLLDDFKVMLGGQMEVVEIGGFSATVKIASVFRRQETALVRVAGFGSDVGLLAGYYRRSWCIAGELGFDKAIATHMQHTDVMRAVFPGIKDGWYVPTGGHYYYGIQGGATIGESMAVSLRLGATRAQEHDENAVLPYYLQLGVGMRF